MGCQLIGRGFVLEKPKIFGPFRMVPLQLLQFIPQQERLFHTRNRILLLSSKSSGGFWRHTAIVLRQNPPFPQTRKSVGIKQP